jgi:hypothetical protein
MARWDHPSGGGLPGRRSLDFRCLGVRSSKGYGSVGAQAGRGFARRGGSKALEAFFRALVSGHPGDPGGVSACLARPPLVLAGLAEKLAGEPDEGGCRRNEESGGDPREGLAGEQRVDADEAHG